MSREFTVQYTVNDENSEEFKDWWAGVHQKLGQPSGDSVEKGAIDVTAIAQGNLFRRLELVKQAIGEAQGPNLDCILTELLSLTDDQLILVTGFDYEEILYEESPDNTEGFSP